MFNNNKSGDLIVCRTKHPSINPIPTPVSISAEDRFLHTLILGPTGCGKSDAMLSMIQQDIDNPEWGATVLDPKGGLALHAFLLAKESGRSAFLFDPTLKNCPKYNPLAGREVDVVENIVTVFRLINADSPQFFLDLNEQLLRNTGRPSWHISPYSRHQCILVVSPGHWDEIQFESKNTLSNKISFSDFIIKFFAEIIAFMDNLNKLFRFSPCQIPNFPRWVGT